MIRSQGKALLALVLPVAAGAASIAFSWLRWISPFVDSGREMDVPARLLAGERLYRDVTYNYGPAGPWLNAVALRVFGHRFAALEWVGLLLSIAILVLLFRLTMRAGSFLSAVVATTVTATICLGAPWGGSFIFPYAFANLYGLAGSLLALLCFGREPARGRDLALAVLGLTLSVTARPELGTATVLILLIAGMRSSDWRRSGRQALLVVGTAGVVSVAVYGLAFAGIPWQTLRREVPYLHLGSLPPEWQHFYKWAAGLLHPWLSLRILFVGVVADVLLLAAFAWLLRPRPVAGEDAAELRWPPVWLAAEVLILAAALATWQVMAGDNGLPPLLFPLPVLAPIAAAVLFLRRPLGARARDRFMLCALAAVVASRVLLSLDVGPAMEAYDALGVPCALAMACVLGFDVLAPRLPDPATFRRRLAVALLLFGGLFLYQLRSVDARAVRLDTRAGTLRLREREARAVNQTLDYLAQNARPGDALATFPESGFFNFITGLRNPLRENLILPGVLDDAGEAEVLQRLDREKPRFFLLCYRPTWEFGTARFGKGYAAHLWGEVEKRYTQVASFGSPPHIPGQKGSWFVRIYERSPALTEGAAER
ncbi:MAG: hypothetical protein JF614_18175 [Acidobacteria bacterium]|nr:hypothetical protein [Acidobacteriota bacterium]